MEQWCESLVVEGLPSGEIGDHGLETNEAVAEGEQRPERIFKI